MPVVVRWFTQREAGGFPVHHAALAGCDLLIEIAHAGHKVTSEAKTMNSVVPGDKRLR